ncbi:MAG: hypothetical protein LUH00_08530 [Lachnospiraceae bacterium]|nr:hypothetical protein [Lachnospiraceae bacterium]
MLRASDTRLATTEAKRKPHPALTGKLPYALLRIKKGTTFQWFPKEVPAGIEPAIEVLQTFAQRGQKAFKSGRFGISFFHMFSGF